MSKARTTTSQIIANGEYLNQNFDPKTLTVAQLIGIFVFHRVSYPSRHNKTKLVEIFKQEIVNNGTEMRRHRQETHTVLASAAGIIDGVTAEPIEQVRFSVFCTSDEAHNFIATRTSTALILRADSHRKHQDRQTNRLSQTKM